MESRPRDLSEVGATMQKWLSERLPAGPEVTVGDLEFCDTGFSGELIMFSVGGRPASSRETEHMVLRVEPQVQDQLFLDTVFEEQYRALEALYHRSDVPVPQPIGFESDLGLLGSRFYVMSRAEGRTGALWLPWMTSLNDEDLERTWWSGLETMARMHRVDVVGSGLGFLDQPARGEDAIDQLLDYNREYYEWVRDGEHRTAIEAAEAWLRANKPDPLPPCGFVWGDAKRGNMLFGDDLGCTAVLDFEMMSLGPAEMDLAYWIEGEHQTAEMMGMRSPTVEETTERYAALLGRDVAPLGYYMVLAALRIAVLRVKLWYLREGEEMRGDKYAGDMRLAHVLNTWAGVSLEL